MKRIRTILYAVLTLSLVAGYTPSMTEYGGIQMKQTVVKAAAADKKITVKVASDITLKLPASWKNNYVRKSSKYKKHGLYITFSSKKCYKQTKEGWLFSIMRCKDDSYTDMPSYEVAGRWNGYYYVVLFPTDVQTMGATKAAKRQYQKMSGDVMEIFNSLRSDIKEKKKR